jgi:hypothetical protein
MEALKLSLDKIYEEDSVTVTVIMGTLFGYSDKAISFFLEGKMDGGRGIPCFLKYSSSGIATYEEFSISGFSGTGYISYPKEIRDLIDNKISMEEIINDINKRRLLTTTFPDEGKEDRFIFIDKEKLTDYQITQFKKYEI